MHNHPQRRALAPPGSSQSEGTQSTLSRLVHSLAPPIRGQAAQGTLSGGACPAHVSLGLIFSRACWAGSGACPAAGEETGFPARENSVTLGDTEELSQRSRTFKPERLTLPGGLGGLPGQAWPGGEGGVGQGGDSAKTLGGMEPSGWGALNLDFVLEDPPGPQRGISSDPSRVGGSCCLILL